VLKYYDDESDYVTLDSQEELITALNYSPNVLRILVESKNPPSTNSSDGFSKKCHKRHQGERGMSYHGKDHHGHDWKERHHGLHGDHPTYYGGHPGWKVHQYPRHGYNGGHPGWKDNQHPHHGHHEFKDCNMKSTEHRNLCREKKIAYINQFLSDFGTDDSTLTPRALFRKQKLLRKKQRIESCPKGQCFNQRKQGLTSPEEEQYNQNIKNQILAVKIEAMKVKARKREIKIMLQDKADDKALRDELSALHEQMKLFHNQKKSSY